MPTLIYKKMTIEDLVSHSQKNDFKALEELIKREQKNIYATFSYLSKNKENVADLTQEALLRIAKNITTLKNPKNYKSWQNQIITNLFYDELRKKQKRPDLLSLDNEDQQATIKWQLLDNKCKPNEKCLIGELEEIIKNAIQDLPTQFRIAIILRELQGLTYDEIAEATNTSIGTVKSRIARAREKLQEGLKSYI